MVRRLRGDQSGLPAAVRLPMRIFYTDGSVEHFDEVAPDRRYPLEATSRHLVDLILDDGAINVSSGEIGARTVELLEAAYRSAAERRLVLVSEL